MSFKGSVAGSIIFIGYAAKKTICNLPFCRRIEHGYIRLRFYFQINKYYQNKRVLGEWFKLSKEDIIEISDLLLMESDCYFIIDNMA
jgi:hypothetical protein